MLSSVEMKGVEFCGPTAIAACLGLEIELVNNACKDAIQRARGGRKPRKVKGMFELEVAMAINCLTDSSLSKSSWKWYEGKGLVTLKEFIETKGSSGKWRGKNLIIGLGTGRRGHYVALNGNKLVDTGSGGCIIPANESKHRRKFLDSILVVDDLKITQGAQKRYG